jgi:hypothetical protein
MCWPDSSNNQERALCFRVRGCRRCQKVGKWVEGFKAGDSVAAITPAAGGYEKRFDEILRRMPNVKPLSRAENSQDLCQRRSKRQST